MSDRDTINNNADPDKRVVQSAHPDKEGRGTLRVLQNQDWVPGMKFVASWWESNGRGKEGVDLNYAFQDGSVSRYNGVGNHDEDMGAVPESNMGFQGWWVTVPPQK